MSSTVTLPFTVVHAFTNSVSGGNPAAVVFLPSLTSLTDSEFQSIAENFNQPITAFISQSTPSLPRTASGDLLATEAGATAAGLDAEDTEAEFGIRWFTASSEIPLCGHGSLASAHAIFAHSPPLVSLSVSSIKFTSPAGQVVVVKKIYGGKLELTLENAAPLAAIENGEERQLRKAVTDAIGEQVPIRYMGKSTKPSFKNYCLVEVDVENLETLKVDVKALMGSPFNVNVLTSAAAVPGAQCSTRMFAPLCGVDEDPVCGTAHCLVGPYWAAKKSLESVFMARMASKRGGDLRVTVDAAKDPDFIKLAGELRTVSKGELFL